MTLRIALIAGLAEPVTAASRTEPAAFAFETACALSWLAAATGDFAADLFARRGSRTPLPLVSLDPAEVLSDYDDALNAERAAADDALLCQVAQSGLLDGYDVVHSLPPILSALQIAATAGAAIVQTVDRGAKHASARILPSICKQERLAQVIIGRAGSDGYRCVPAGVDLVRFALAEEPSDDFLLWLGEEGEAAAEAARRTAAALHVPLRGFDDGDVAALLPHARALLQLGPGWVWPLRALVCGTPVVGWSGFGWQELHDDAGVGVASAGDVDGLIEGVRVAAGGRTMRQARRQVCLALHGSRAMASHYCQIYRSLAEAS